MNGNSDKHNKPLSPEELFRLLETKEQDAFGGEGLDDFEKEALEGFSSHTSAEKARQLTEEVHQRIHEQVGEKKSQRPIGRIVWFSAAASVMLALIVSAYFLAQEAKVSEELALNKEVSERMKDMPEPAVSEPLPAVMDDAQEKENTEDNKKQSKPQLPGREATISQGPGPLEKSAASGGLVANDKQDDANRLKNEALADVSTETSKDEAKKSLGQGTVFSDTRLAERSEQEDRKGYVTTNGFSSPNKTAAKADQLSSVPAEEKMQSVSPVTTYESVAVTGKNKTKQPSQKRKEADADKEKSPATTATGSSNLEVSNATTVPVRNASYTGGEKAVKNHVINWLKDHQYGIPEKGSYTIRLKVFANGSVETLEVKAGPQAEQSFTEPLKKALDAMKGWNPAVIDQHAADSEAALTLSF